MNQQDIGNIAVLYGYRSEDVPEVIFLASHRGEEVPDILAQSLSEAQARWDEPEFLTGTIAAKLFEADREGGVSITTHLVENTRPNLLVVIPQRKEVIALTQQMYEESKFSMIEQAPRSSFEDYVQGKRTWDNISAAQGTTTGASA